MHQQDPTQDVPVLHHATTGERGSFAIARCNCGWTGPARRSRERARTDAQVHLSASLTAP
ncbi:hypothetical protein [Streptomyces sp. NBC_00829]|uniref:hypothetical protein n=1 Tax=Streptomyces sp. NBC_00829 TaxID=2903679 RepID=UPI003865070B|nr:hypothetical protein OG293_18940 [Streptomyces sp. NBC_00829]